MEPAKAGKHCIFLTLQPSAAPEVFLTTEEKEEACVYGLIYLYPVLSPKDLFMINTYYGPSSNEL